MGVLLHGGDALVIGVYNVDERGEVKSELTLNETGERMVVDGIARWTPPREWPPTPNHYGWACPSWDVEGTGRTHGVT